MALKNAIKEKESLIFKLETSKNEIIKKLNTNLVETKSKFETDLKQVRKEHKLEIKSLRKELGTERSGRIRLERTMLKDSSQKSTVYATVSTNTVENMVPYFSTNVFGNVVWKEQHKSENLIDGEKEVKKIVHTSFVLNT